jgi:hypothetical protein
VVFKGKNPKQAWDLVLFLDSPASMASYNSVITSIPPRTDVSATWAVKPETAQFFAEQARMMPKKLQLQQLMPVYAATRGKPKRLCQRPANSG